MSRTLGRYILDRKLATGGMAEIWLGHQQGPANFEKQVVIKKILPHLAEDPKFIEMFLDEARLAAKLSHANIVQIFDLGDADGDYFIAMEFIDGHDVHALIERATAVGATFSPAVAARIVADACVGLDYAHTFRDRDGTPVQLVHRDVSPQNILVSNDGIVKLVDFGVAKAATSSHKTQTGAVKGKLSYMSPEQIGGNRIDGRSDIFALGIVLYELVTGRRPFGHESELLAITAILNEHPPRPCEVVYNMPPELEAVILKALEKDPEQRYQSASEMQLALEHVLRRMGAILTPREVRTYIDDLFSESPSAAVSDAGQAALIGVTHVDHPSAETRPEFQGVPFESAVPVTAKPRAAMSDQVYFQPPAAESADDVPIKPPSKAPIIAALIVVLFLLAGGAVTLFIVFGPGAGDDENDVAALDDDEEQDDHETNDDDRDDEQLDRTTADVSGDDNEDTDPATTVARDDKPPIDGSGETERAGSGDEAHVDGSGDAETDAPDAGTDTDEADAMDNANVDGDVANVGADAGGVDEADTEALDSTAEPTVDVTPEEVPEEAPEPERVDRVEDGVISVVVPGGSATIYIDGDRVGSYPGSTRFTVEEGRHEVRVESGDGETFRETVRVPGDGTVRVRVRY